MIRLITGGQRSGKSAFAEKLLAPYEDVVYFATAEYRADDAEFTARIKAHQARRKKSWRTVECYKDFAGKLGTEKQYLLDCVTNSVSRFLFEYTAGLDTLGQIDFEKTKAAVQRCFSELIAAVHKKNADLILVTNEVGSATIPMNTLARFFVDLQGCTNSFLAACSDEVYFCVAGIPVKIKG